MICCVFKGSRTHLHVTLLAESYDAFTFYTMKFVSVQSDYTRNYSSTQMKFECIECILLPLKLKESAEQ